MRRQLRVTDPSGCDTLMNVECEGTVWADMKRDASRRAGGSARSWRVVLVPIGWEMDLPFDEIPVVVPRYPLPNETHAICTECQHTFMAGQNVQMTRPFCSIACRERDARRKARLARV
jgi:hypothetical protein